MAKLTASLVKREKIADGTYAFTLNPSGGQPFAYRAGQTIDVTFPNLPRADATGNRRTFSIAEAPGRDHLLVATRVRGSGFKQSLVEAPLGTELEVEGPFGSFTLPNKPSDVVLLAGGVGITPFRAMVEDTIERSLDHTLSLIHSNRTPEETPFLEDLIRWGIESAKETESDRERRKRARRESAAEKMNADSGGKGTGKKGTVTNGGSAGASTAIESGRPRFVYLPTMTQAHRSARGWPGETRRISPLLLAEILPIPHNRHLYYVAGPARFVAAGVDSLKSIGVDEDLIRFEEFLGY